MDVTCVDGHSGPWVVKRAGSAEESDRLRHEAIVLGQAAHPGVVEVGTIEVGAGELVTLSTRHAGGCDLSTITGLDVAELSGLGAAVATIIADLHDLGLVHAAVCPEHIIVGADGRPVLCSLGRAGRTSELDPAVDVAAIRRLLSERLPAGAPRKLTRLLCDPPHRSRRGSARVLAASLSRIVPDARLPVMATRLVASIDPQAAAGPGHGVTEPEPSAPATTSPTALSVDPPAESPIKPTSGRSSSIPFRLPGQHRPDRAVVVGLAAAAAAVVGVASLAVSGALGAGHIPTAARTVAASCPVADAGCGPVPSTDGQFSTPSGHFAIDLPTAVVVVGRWGCRGPSLPAALDPRTGRLWVWNRWPGTTTIAARSLGRVGLATTLAVIPEASGCDWLEVIRSAGQPIVIHPQPETTYG